MLKNANYVYGAADLVVPASLNFGAFMLNSLWTHRGTTTLINGTTNESLTCGDIAQEAMNLAVSLGRFGLTKGDVVAIYSENRSEFWGTVIGIACTGAIVTTINPGYSKDELKHVMDISKPKYVFCSTQTYGLITKLMTSSKSIKKIIIYGDREKNEKYTIVYQDLVVPSDSRELARNIDFEEFKAVDVEGQTDTLFILYSSGTTGLPKGVMLTHLNVLASCCLDPIMQQETTNLTMTPWYHTMGLVGTLRSLAIGAKTVYLPKFEIDTYLNIIELYKVTNLIVVPPVLVALCKYQSEHDVSSVSIIYSGAAPLHSDTIKDVHKRFPKLQSVLQGYGMTEATLAITRDTPNEIHLAKLGGVGFIVKGAVVKVVDLESRKPSGPNQHGEICVKGVIIMKGYIGKNKQDDFDEEGFFKTGDIGYYDQDKYFYIVDRLKELIKYKAYQVPPMELEAVLLQHPGVRDVGVVGIPHASAGEVPMAFVVPQPGANITEIELQELVAARLSNPKHLRGGVRFIKEIPKTPAGKYLENIYEIWSRLKEVNCEPNCTICNMYLFRKFKIKAHKNNKNKNFS